jgi:hypothetical protein
MRLALVVVAVAGCAGRAPPPPAPPPSAAPTACPPDGELYQVLVNPADDDPDAFAERTVVYLGGGWIHEQDGRAPERGCLAAAQVTQITTALDRATWMQVVTGTPCPPEGRITTIYFVNGAPVHETTCGAILDEPSRRAVSEIDALVLTARGR